MQPKVAETFMTAYCDVQPNIAESGMDMEFGSIAREIHIDASPEVVFEVVSRPEHIREWWSANAQFEPVAGAVGELVWDNGETPRSNVVPITVVDAEPPRLFSFRWAYSADEIVAPVDSLLVTFELAPSGEGTVLRLTETGFREQGWEAAVLEAHYQDHSNGWDTFVPRIATYVTRLVASS
jgi:uncharacterized protein YndB with AHSA1/START domain